MEVGVGAFDVFGRDEPRRSAVGRLELRIGEKVYFVGLAIGLMANTDGGVYGYGGFYADLVYGDFVLTPFLGFGGYREGGSKDLGGVFQFRSGGTLAYAFPDGSRLGIHVGHLSNAYIHEDNDGEEDIMLTYGFAF